MIKPINTLSDSELEKHTIMTLSQNLPLEKQEDFERQIGKSFIELVKVIQGLRHPELGCPWDLQQNHEGLTQYLIEESFEYIHAVENQDPKNMQEELGDVLLQVLLNSQIAQEEKKFSILNVIDSIQKKLLTRHPHVFKKTAEHQYSIKSLQERQSEGQPQTAKNVREQWEHIKQKENINIPKVQGPYAKISNKRLNNTALASAQDIGEKTQNLNFDWTDATQVIYKVEEEWQELKEELTSFAHASSKLPEEIKNLKQRIDEEMGDYLFSIVQLCRHLNINSEKILRSANKKFINRFQLMIDLIQKDYPPKDINALYPQNLLEIYWNKAKKAIKEN